MAVVTMSALGIANEAVMRKVKTQYWVDRYQALTVDNQVDRVSISQFDLCCQELEKLGVTFEEIDFLVYLAD